MIFGIGMGVMEILDPSVTFIGLMVEDANYGVRKHPVLSN